MFSDGDDFETPAAHAARQKADVEEKQGRIVRIEKTMTSCSVIMASTFSSNSLLISHQQGFVGAADCCEEPPGMCVLHMNSKFEK